MNLFAYGTLCVPDVMHAVVGRELEGSPATLEQYRRRLISGCVFPGITAAPDEEVAGTLFLNLDEATMTRLDAYEASFYERRSVSVRSPNAADPVPAEAYVLPASEAWRLSDLVWDEAVFVREELPSYLSW